MTKAADIIAALLAGKKPAPVVERQTGMPYGWGLWMRAHHERLGAIRRDAADRLVHALMQRPLREIPPRPLALNRWQAFRSLFYQDWGPPLREERGLRWLAGSLTLLMHLLFVLLLVLFALVRIVPSVPPGEESRVRLEIIGKGTPQEEGGGPPAAEAESAEAAAAAAQTAAAQPPSAPPTSTDQAAETPPVPQQEIPQPSPAAAQQNLQVTETLAPTIEFVLPPTTRRTPQIAPPQIRAPQIGVPTREVTVVQVPPAQRELPQREIAVPQVSQPALEVRQREIPAPLPQVRTVQVPARAIAAPEVRASTPSVREAEIAAPDRAAASSSSNASSTNPASTGTAAQAVASPRGGTQPGATAAGPAAVDRPGGSSTPQRGDDWGASTRNTPGQTGSRAGEGPGTGPGLFNADGSVRVPGDATGDSTRPGAPGSRQQQQTDADRGSKWLDRPDYPYEPTMFDKYWRPTDESLLGEWVRRAIREVEIPIPGTSKKVKCVVSVLQAGGACSLFDPNLNEQPAIARPPPDIPVKRNPIPTDS
ncbi:MAG TPA: transmembrane repetitive protein [Pseudoxanthomonas sp.]